MIAHTLSTRRRQIARLRQIAEGALAAFGIAPDSLSLLAHAYNTTFAVTTPDGERYVLHILRPVDADLPQSQRQLRVESELWWLDRVRLDLGLVVPVPLRMPEGNGVASVTLDEIEPARLCTLLHWVDGRFVQRRLMPSHLSAVGELTARLHEYSASLRVPDWFDRPVVDRADSELEEELAGLFQEHVSHNAAPVIRGVLERVLRAQDRLDRGPGNFGLIHADIHQHNYLFHQGEVRLIDFGDCGW